MNFEEKGELLDIDERGGEKGGMLEDFEEREGVREKMGEKKGVLNRHGRRRSYAAAVKF